MRTLAAVVLVLLTGCGCGLLGKKPVPIPAPVPADPESESVADRIKYEAAWIREYADPGNSNYETTEKMEKITAGAVTIHDLAKEVDCREVDYQVKIEDLKHGDAKAQKRIWLWVVGLSALMVVGGSVLAFLVNVRMGIGLGLAGIISYIVAYTMISYGWVLALIGLLMVLTAITLLVLTVMKNKGVLVDIIKSFEIVKEKSFTQVKDVIDTVQSPTTKAVAAEVKAELGLDKKKEETPSTPAPATPPATQVP